MAPTRGIQPGAKVKQVAMKQRTAMKSELGVENPGVRGKARERQREMPVSIKVQDLPSYSSQNFVKAEPMLEEPVVLTVEEGEDATVSLDGLADLLKQGAVGIIPTDTYPALVCDCENSDAVDRLYSVKHLRRTRQLSLLCRNLSDIGKYTLGFPSPMEAGQSALFPLIKANMPGPFTFLLNASKELPRQRLPFANTRSRFRKTVGVRLPANTVAQRLLDLLDNPLLCSSCHVSPEEDMDVEVMTAEKLLEAYPTVDFVLDTGETWVTKGSTVIDLTAETPKVLRLGMGDPLLFSDFFPADSLAKLESVAKELEQEEVNI